ncbi:MAG: hypothetical protein NC299_09155 [Lachnospiraceae bacterium]|nr:hypothetical protein [Ruminococcus sp.]MCM1275520.1 hypothetical protein [Lachnospiraceae bacterium]
MAAFICRMCGALLELPDGSGTCTCKSCGVLQSVPLLDNGEKFRACKNAERLRREGHYDKALELLNGLIRLSPTDADLYWAAALCRYGVSFSENKLTVENAPAKSLLSDEDYKTALKYADETQRTIMEGAAAKIDEVRRKSAADTLGGDRNVILYCGSDALRARISAKLTSAGYIVSDNENAPDSAKAALVVGESAEDFRTDLWKRFAASGKTVIPVFRGLPPEDLPEELRRLQACDMDKLGWESGILNALAAIFGKAAAEPPPSRSAEPMLRRIYIMLDDGDFSGADRIASQLIEKEKNNPKLCAEAYLARLLCEYGVSSEEQLAELRGDFTKSENYRRAMQLGSENLHIRLRRLLRNKTASEQSPPTS